MKAGECYDPMCEKHNQPKPTDARHRRQLDEGVKQLAAEKERPCAWCESERDEVLRQLAAYKQQAESMLTTSKRVNDQLREQLAAERELLEQGITAGADWDWHNRVKAALAKAKEGK